MIKAEDYQNDTEFSSIYNYLEDGKLTNNDKIDKVTLLLADSFIIENELLYKLTTPRNKMERRLRPLSKRLCVPLLYRYNLINHIHCDFGHFGIVQNFLTISQRYFWKGLYLSLIHI